MMPAVLKFILNIGLLSTMLFAPIFLIMSHWYRKAIRGVLLLWRRPEASFLTIVYAIVGIILFTICISCFFNYWKYYPEGTPNGGISLDRLRDIGAIALLFLTTISLLFFALRLLFVQVITEQGIILNRSFLRFPNVRDVIEWNELTDYFVSEDYPNSVFTLIYNKEGELKRYSMPVPSHQRQNFSELLDSQLDRRYESIGFPSRNKRKLSDL